MFLDSNSMLSYNDITWQIDQNVNGEMIVFILSNYQTQGRYRRVSKDDLLFTLTRTVLLYQFRGTGVGDVQLYSRVPLGL